MRSLERKRCRLEMEIVKGKLKVLTVPALTGPDPKQSGFCISELK